MRETHRNPLASEAQLAAEKKLLWLLEQSEIKVARAYVRDLVFADPDARSPEGRRLGERALDKWLSKLALDSIGRGSAVAHILWNNQIASYDWFGHRVPGSAAAVDNPDFLYRAVSIDGDAEYELTGAAQAPAGLIAFQLTDEPGGRQGFAMRNSGVYDIESVAQLGDHEILRRPDGSFTITFGPSAANGRANHIQTPPRRLAVIIRNMLDRWTLNAHHLELKRLDGRPESAALSDAAIVEQVAQDLEHYVRFWLDYRDHYAGKPAANTLAGPYVRNGAWSSAAAARIELAPDEALVLTVNEVDAAYVGIQIVDTYTISPNPLAHSCCFNRTQSRRNGDGSLTYVAARRDPGVANWLDNAGAGEGYLQLRWVGLPQHSGPLIRQFDKIKLKDLSHHIEPDQAITPEARRAQIQQRQSDWAHRITVS